MKISTLGVCVYCHTRTYDTRRDARAAAHMIEMRPRPYPCPHIHGGRHIRQLTAAVVSGRHSRDDIYRHTTEALQ